MFDQSYVANADINLAILDVRGTVIDGERDLAISYKLLKEIVAWLRQNKSIALMSGCSRATVEQLIIRPWQKLAQLNTDFTIKASTSLFVYTENGCRGYNLTGCINLAELDGYSSDTLDPNVNARITKILEELSLSLGLTADIQPRSGQINFYFNASFAKRQRIGGIIRERFAQADLPGLNVMIPTSKSVIDISRRSKAVALTDLLTRIGISCLTNVLAVSDSFQIGGADEAIIDMLRGAQLVHVGATDMKMPAYVSVLGGGPEGTLETLSAWRNRGNVVEIEQRA